jgi:hypothetical protein
MMKVVFHDMPVTRVDPSHGAKCFEVIEPFRFQIDNDLIEVPVCFWTDWASTGLASSIISPIHHTICRSSLGHDFLYFCGYRGSQAVCDEFIAAGMRVDGAEWWRRSVVWAGVAIGGKRTWDRYRRENTKWVQTPSFNSLRCGEPLTKLTIQNFRKSDGFV